MVGPTHETDSADGLQARFECNLSPDERQGLAAARDWSDRAAMPLYLVGGGVRDLLLGSRHFDLDLAADGDVVALARALAERFQLELTVHEQFSTVRLAAPRWSMDIARTRRERYAYPGALPYVEPAPIESDLGRRDFTIHAMALSLAGRTAGELLDPFGGRDDLGRRVLRVLYRESFRDDPTRIVRLARYASRLQFGLEPETRRLAAHDATFLRVISGARVTHELARTLAEQNPEGALRLLDDLHALHPLTPYFRLPADLDAVFDRLRRLAGTPSVNAYLAALAARWDRHAIQQVMDRLELRHEAVSALRACPAVDQALRRLAADNAVAVETVEALTPYPLDALFGVAAALGGAACALVRNYHQRWLTVRPELRGDELTALGVPYGPAIGEVLRLLRNGRLRGELRSRGDEERAVRRWVNIRAEAS